jgi:ribosomal protein S18 acetylase RimI-like enzyme
MATELSYECTDRPAADDLDAVDAGLHLHNINAVDFDALRTLACFARDRAGAVLGGLRARQWGAAVEVQQLWVEPSLRRRGIGRRLMQLLEDEVRRRGATLIFLDTFSFQAPGFYTRCGFCAAVRLDGFPDGIAKYVMVKRLDEAGSGEAAMAVDAAARDASGRDDGSRDDGADGGSGIDGSGGDGGAGDD